MYNQDCSEVSVDLRLRASSLSYYISCNYYINLKMQMDNWILIY